MQKRSLKCLHFLRENFCLFDIRRSFFVLIAVNCLDHALEVVKNEIIRLDNSMEKAGEFLFVKNFDFYD